MKLSQVGIPFTFTTSRLFATGAIVGPLVDSLHNQCLLEYHRAPVTLTWPLEFCSSLWVPPLLGFAYVVLGGILPQWLSSFVEKTTFSLPKSVESLRTTANTAVVTTALLIKLSEVLETQAFFSDTMNTGVLICLAVLQWAWLDRTLTAFLIASITSVGGPWSELPFVAANFWEYLSPDSFPLSNLPWIDPESTVAHLGLKSITGPCYFAVTMDAIALGRWYSALDIENNNSNNNNSRVAEK